MKLIEPYSFGTGPDCHAVHDELARHAGRIVVHYLPKYAPETNPIERLWRQLHETISRNHRCRTIDEQLNGVSQWADAHIIGFRNQPPSSKRAVSA